MYNFLPHAIQPLFGGPIADNAWTEPVAHHVTYGAAVKMQQWAQLRPVHDVACVKESGEAETAIPYAMSRHRSVTRAWLIATELVICIWSKVFEAKVAFVGWTPRAYLVVRRSLATRFIRCVISIHSHVPYARTVFTAANEFTCVRMGLPRDEFLSKGPRIHGKRTDK